MSLAALFLYAVTHLTPTVQAAAITAGSVVGAAIISWLRERRPGRATLSQLMQDAAEKAVSSVSASLDVAREDLRHARNDLTEARNQLDGLSSQLDAARGELRLAIESRDQLHYELAQRDFTIGELRAEIAALRARLRDLEARVGGRRDHDPPAPALG